MPMAGSVLSIRQRLGLSLVALISISYGLLMATNELVIRRDRLQRHERLVMATAMAIEKHLNAGGGRMLATHTPEGERRVREELNDFSATRVMVWLSRPSAQPIFPASPAVQGFLRDRPLLEAAGVDAVGMQKPRSFNYQGQTYFTCSMPLPSGQGVLRFLEDVGVSPASRRDNLMLLAGVWLLLVLFSVLLIRPLTSVALRPLRRLELVMDRLSLQPSGVVSGERINTDDNPFELRGIATSYNQLADRLQKAWTQQQLFMRAVSHELLTPITLIGSSARRLARHCVDLANADQQLLMSIQDEAGRVDRLVRNLLDLARNDSGNLSLHSDAFIPLLIIQETLRDVAAIPWGGRVSLRPYAEGDLASAEVKGDPERLRQCLLNVLENAAKYSPPDQPIELSVMATSAAVQIRIQDRGLGINPLEREKIFQPFYRSDQARDQQAGSGVGLAIVRLLIERMGGTVMVVDGDQPGTTMQFELPRSDVRS